MITELDLKKEIIFEDLFYILKQYEHTTTIDGIQFMLDNIVDGIGDGREIKDDITDINYILNLTLEELGKITLTKEHNNIFDDAKDMLFNIEVIKNYNQGELVIYDLFPFIVSEVDYEDLTIHLSDGSMMDNGIWIEDFTLLSKSINK
jgi:hypothetical protein|tara:strand:- start:978 stop:1421 length:444 start_codon:yes stop_codon:yes gene_type:complete